MGISPQLSPRAAFNHAIDLVHAGRVSAAATFCRDFLRRTPGDVNMTALLGAVLLKLRQFKDAERHLRRAIELAPSFAKPHEDLGYLLVEQGRAEEAVEGLKTATRLDPQAEMAFFTLGRALSMTGMGAEADAAFEAAFALNPSRKRLALAAEHHKAGRHEEAARLYRHLLRETPNDVDAMRLLAGVLMRKSEVEEAEVLLRKAIALAPDYALAFLDLGQLLQEQFRYAEAIDCFQRTIELQPAAVKPHFLLASTLASAGHTFDALASYRRVLKLQPRHAGAWLGLGHTLKTVGRQEEAVQAYRECIRIRPDNGESYWSLANLKTYQLAQGDIREMQAALERTDQLAEQSAVNFLFALAKAHEDQGDFDAAWGYYARGNAKQRQLEYYDPVQTEVTNDEIMEVFDQPFLERNTGLGHADEAPIFVVGLPRSGSTPGRTDSGQPQLGRGHFGTGLPRPRCDLAEPQPRRRRQLPSRGARTASAAPQGAGPGLSAPSPAAPADGPPPLHRQDAQQLPFHRLSAPHPAQRQDHRRPALSLGFHPKLLPPTVRQGPNLRL